MTSENAPSIGIHHENRMIAGVEKDGIGGFGADAIQIEEFFSKSFCRPRQQSRQRASVFLVQKHDEKFQPPGLLTEITGGTNQALEFSQRYPANSVRAKHAGRATI